MPRIKESASDVLPEVTAPRRTKVSAASVSTPVESRKKIGVGKIIKVLFYILFLLAVVAAGYYYRQYRKITGSDRSAEIDSLVSEIRKVMELPSDEMPTLATVTDKEKLSAQAFFQRAENNDKVLIYAKAGKAILYRPSTHKIIDVSTVNIADDKKASASAAENNTTDTTTASSTVASYPTAVLYNGAKTLGLTYKVEDQMKKEFPNVDIVKKQSALKRDYTKTMIVDISGKYGEFVDDIAKNLSAEVGFLPVGESKPNADILIIVGEDKAR